MPGSEVPHVADATTTPPLTSRRSWAVGARPLHPPVVHTAIGGVVIAAVSDVVSIAGGEGHAWAQAWFKGGSYALLVASAVMLVAIATGILERERRTQPESPARGAVNRHAIVMSLMAAVSVVDVVLRLGHYSSASHSPLAVLVLTWAAVVLTVIGGELGGRLVYRRGIAVHDGA